VTAFAHPVLQATIDEALRTTGARTGVVVAVTSAGLAVAATAGPVGPAAAVGAPLEARGARGYVLASGQPTALAPDPSDASNAGAGGADGVPGSLLVVPGRGGVVVELADRPDGPFTIDHMDAVGSLAVIADAALAGGASSDEVVPPARLGAELAALAATSPGRYRDVARAVEALLSLGR
jgi:hypothetical protein